MKVPTLIITASVALALVVPAAVNAQVLQASVTHRILPATSPVSGQTSGKSIAVTIKTLKAQNKALQAQNKALQAENRALENTIQSLRNPTPNLPGGGGTLPIEDCSSYMVCTPEEDCLIWGNNCNLVSPTVSTSTDESAAVAPAAETAVADSSANSSATSSESTGPVAEVTPVELSSNIDENEYYGGGY